ncbi:S26 family signal peptidase [Nonomuraea guangzhouensis]|uniref:S26 family signal peptidase n=1 Tax=Nonomuraea guangzhouensis TaxID=1291555 RepID=A0ABW4GCV5_9ACTN|nr:S26 family signal peptidase [Nonomuraea guangzhouensis]
MWAVLFGVVISAGVAIVVARAALVVVTVRGGSMEPTLRDGDRVIVARWRRRRIQRDAVVVCRAPDGLVLPGMPPSTAADPALLVKRVSGVAGDRQPDGRIVPVGHIYLLGDAGADLDSREFGPVPIVSVVGSMIGRAPGLPSSS